MIKIKHIAIILPVLLMIGCGSKKKNSTTQKQKTAAAADSTSSVAQMVQNATFTDLNGNTVKLSDYKGKVVLIDFWETWCKPCVASMPTLEKLMKKYPNNFQVLAVNPGFSNTKKDVQQFVANHNYDFKYLLDSSNLHKKLGIQGIPYKVFVAPDGHFIKKTMGSAGPKADFEHIEKVIKKYKQNS